MRKILAFFGALFLTFSVHAADITNLSGSQLPGTTTNDNAAAGNVGQLISSNCPSSATTATITVTIATPGVVTWTAHGFTSACPVVFTTTGALPTGITAGTTYYVVPSSVTANTFQIATTVPNALAGTSITTSGTQSGTQTGTAGAALHTSTTADITGISLTAGDWDVSGVVCYTFGSTTSVTIYVGSVVNNTVTNATIGVNGLSFSQDQPATVPGNLYDACHNISNYRASLAATSTYFLSTTMAFTVSTATAYGYLRARRVR